MNQLTLEWLEAGHIKTQVIADQQPTKNPGTTRIGRDPTRCDVVISHPTVSGLHVEIFFDSQRHNFFLRNLRDTNPPVINRQKLVKGEVVLQQGMSFYLGQVELRIVAIAFAVPKTVIVSPQPVSPTVPVPATAQTPISKPQAPTYGLMCPRCRQVSPYDRLGLGCSWCGASLAAAASILMIPEEK